MQEKQNKKNLSFLEKWGFLILKKQFSSHPSSGIAFLLGLARRTTSFLRSLFS